MNNVFEICKLLIAGQLVIDYVGMKRIPKKKFELARKRIAQLDMLSTEWERNNNVKEFMKFHKGAK